MVLRQLDPFETNSSLCPLGTVCFIRNPGMNVVAGLMIQGFDQVPSLVRDDCFILF